MPSSIEKIIERATITFPKPQTLNQVEKLLHYAATDLPADVGCNSAYWTSFCYIGNSKVSKHNGSIKIIASIKSLKSPLAFDFLESKASDKDSSHISSLAFQMVPGWDILDYRPEVLNLWDEFKCLTEKYFSERH